jgi:hypothetical protein
LKNFNQFEDVRQILQPTLIRHARCKFQLDQRRQRNEFDAVSFHRDLRWLRKRNWLWPSITRIIPCQNELDLDLELRVAKMFASEVLVTLTSLSMDERGSWRLVLGTGQEIRLGRRDIDERLYRFFDVVAPALAPDLARVEYVDLRYTNGFAVGWRDGPPENLAAVAQVPDRG